MKADVMNLETLNAASPKFFCSILSGIFEHSPWVARSVVSKRPFSTVKELYQSMLEEVMQASEEEQMALICAHPDLATSRTVQRDPMTEESMMEQKRAGLDKLDDKELSEFHQLNAAYREHFGFPCVIAVRGFDELHDKFSILATIRARLRNTRRDEHQEALRQIARIAELRLNDLIGK